MAKCNASSHTVQSQGMYEVELWRTVCGLGTVRINVIWWESRGQKPRENVGWTPGHQEE